MTPAARGALARLATVDADGMPHVVPVGWSWDDSTGELVLGGRDVLRTRRAKHVRATGVAAVTIDGVDTGDGLDPRHGWSPWALVLRGSALVDERAGVIRLRPRHVASWGLDPQDP